MRAQVRNVPLTLLGTNTVPTDAFKAGNFSAVSTVIYDPNTGAADGSGLRPITQTLPGIGVHDFKAPGHVNLAFSPDGQEVAFTSGDRGPTKALWVADVRQGVARQLNLGTNLHPDGEPSWMPPAGDEILFNGLLGSQSGLYAVDVHSGKVRPIVEPSPRFGAGVSTVSPDGSRIAYTQIDNQVTDRNPYQVHIVNSDGSGDVALPMPASAMFQDLPVWSNDGTRLVIVRGYAAHNEDVRLAIVPADGANTSVETKPSITGCCDYAVDWSPDDSRILFLPEDWNGTMTPQLLIDPSTGATTSASWDGISVPAWQRRAP
jgi:Tol biopolymer transport system component